MSTRWGARTTRKTFEFRGEWRAPEHKGPGIDMKISGAESLLGGGNSWNFKIHAPGGLFAESGYIYASVEDAQNAAVHMAEAIYAIRKE